VQFLENFQVNPEMHSQLIHMITFMYYKSHRTEKWANIFVQWLSHFLLLTQTHFLYCSELVIRPIPSWLLANFEVQTLADKCVNSKKKTFHLSLSLPFYWTLLAVNLQHSAKESGSGYWTNMKPFHGPVTRITTCI